MSCVTATEKATSTFATLQNPRITLQINQSPSGGESLHSGSCPSGGANDCLNGGREDRWRSEEAGKDGWRERGER